MPRAPLTFKQSDVARAIRAAKDAGLEVREVRVDKDGAHVIIGKPVEAEAARRNSWDGA